MFFNNLSVSHSGVGYGPYAATYHGVYKTPSSGWSGMNSDIPLDVGTSIPFDDRILLIGAVSDLSTGDFGGPNILINGGINAARLVKSVYGCSWFATDRVYGSKVVISASTTGQHFSIYAFSISGSLNSFDLSTTNIAVASASINNTNSASVTMAGGLVGDRYFGIGAKMGTGATNSWSGIFTNSTLAPSLTTVDDSRIGTSGSGAGGACMSVPQTTASSVSYIAFGGDSTKAITLAMLRLRRRA